MFKSIINTIIFSIKNPKHIKVLVDKFMSRSNAKLEATDEYMQWLEDNKTDVYALMEGLNSELYKETIKFSDSFRAEAKLTLEKLNVTMGGAGIYPFLYFLIKHKNMKTVVETGVAAGYSSNVMLSALPAGGKLYSSDFPYFRIKDGENFIGALVSESNKTKWELFKEGDKINLPRILDKVNEIDLFHYDSDKSVQGREFAMDLIRQKSTDRTILIFDDINDNQHFRELSNEMKDYHGTIFKFEGKFIGMLSKNSL